MADKIILCSGCGAKNRIPAGKTRQASCGACGKTIRGASKPTVNFFSPKFLVFMFAAIFGAALLINENDKGSSSGGEHMPPASTKSASSGSGTANTPAPQARSSPVHISPGVISGPRSPGKAPLGIRTSPGRNYYVKLVDMSGRTEMTFYIPGGQYFETKVPLGTYEMRYAAGETWYGTRHHFGARTVYAKTTDLFRFTETATGYNGYTVELIIQPGGNLGIQGMSASTF